MPYSKFSPFTIGYRYTFLEKMAADIHLGAYASYDIAGKYKRDYTDHIIQHPNMAIEMIRPQAPQKPR